VQLLIALVLQQVHKEKKHAKEKKECCGTIYSAEVLRMALVYEKCLGELESAE
jgi:hypothetical protein